MRMSYVVMRNARMISPQSTPRTQRDAEKRSNAEYRTQKTENKGKNTSAFVKASAVVKTMAGQADTADQIKIFRKIAENC